MEPEALTLSPFVVPALSARGKTFLLLLRYRLAGVRNTIRQLKHESVLKITVVTILGTTFWVGLFLLFWHMFKFLNENVGPFRLDLVSRIFGLFFLALTFMLVFSNAVISLSSLFKAPETAFLFSLPVRHDTIFLYKLMESLLFSSWAVFAAGLPLLLAYGIQSHAAWYFYPCVLLYLVPFVILPAALGSLLGLLLTTIIPRRRTQVLGLLALLLLVVGGYVAVSVLNAHRSASEAGLDSSVMAVLTPLNFTRHPLTPNFWITEGLLAVSESRADWVRAAGLFLGALSSSAAFFLALGWFLSGWVYEAAYSLASSASSARKVVGRTLLERLFSPLLRRSPAVMILVIKDLKTFLRDPAQWSQVLIFFGILTLYIGNLRNFRYPLEQAFYRNLISFLNLGATCMTLATMTSRFVFPLVSLEGRSFWVLGLAPLQRRHIVLAKFCYSFSGALLLTLSLVGLSNYVLRDAGEVLWIQLATAVLLSLGLSGLSVGMGAFFPSFNERNPSKIVSGFGGTLTLILAITLVVFTITGEGLVCHRYLVLPAGDDPARVEAQARTILIAAMAAVAALNLLAAYVPMKLGIRSLEQAEF